MTVQSNPTTPKNHDTRPLKDIYQKITDQIVAKIEEGAGAWKMPWHGEDALRRPVNIKSGLPYRGVNVLALWIATQDKGYETNEWGTYKQWQDKGACVKHGEKATHIVFWKFPESTNTEGDNTTGDMPQSDRPSERLANRVLARDYSVFNAAQVDGYEAKPMPLPSLQSRVTHADEFFNAAQADVVHMGTRAFYSKTHDRIVLPKFDAFPHAEFYYSVRAHETAHWTGHESRLDRPMSAVQGSPEYAKEELLAELTAAFLCADLNLSNEPRRDHAQYMATWLSVLKNEPRAIFTAAGGAQKAADYLHDLYAQTHIPEVEYNQTRIPPAPARQVAHCPRV